MHVVLGEIKINSMKTLALVIGLFAGCFSIAQPLIMDPSLSPNGEQISFSYQGDIWTVSAEGGRADRLTIHEGYESNPVWNNEGTKIAFQSDRFGNNDIFLIDATGSLPDRITYHSGNDVLSSFTPSGDILFSSRRVYAQVEREYEIFKATLDGATPVRYMDAMGFDPVVSPDGSKVAFVRGTCRTAREAYAGPANRDIWLFDMSSGEYTQLTDYEGNDFAPQWLDDNTLIYISSKNGKYNLFRLGLDGTETQLTQEAEFGIFDFGLSPSAGKIVYQSANKIRLFDLSDNSTSDVNIDVSSDYRFDPVVSKSISNDMDGFSVSPDGKLTAYTVRGEVFITRNDKEDSKATRITDGASRERDVEWLNDEILLFVSDRDGQNELYMASSADENETSLFNTLKIAVKRITNTQEEEFDPVVSPDGKKVAFRQGRGKLVVADISETGSLSNYKTLLDGWDTPEGVSWSPDNKWLAYGLSDLNFNQEVYIHAADNSTKPVNVTMHPKYDGNPVWSPDGRKLGFVSMRNNSDNDIWFVWLRKSDWEKSQDEWNREEKEGSEENGNNKDENADVEVVIDFDRIFDRLQRVTGYAGAEVDFAFDKDSEFIYYATGPDWRRNYKVDRGLFKIKWDGSENTGISGIKNPNDLVLGPKQEYIYMLTSGGKLSRLKTSNDKAESLSVSSRLNVRYTEELEQIFEEGWRALNAGFYDPEFHGQDWDALKTQYKPIALSASTKEDFQYFYNLMLGQLNASHMGMYRGENQKETQRQRTGLIGVEGKNVLNGFEITFVLSGSPADKADSKLNVGDVITAVNQEPLTSTTNFYSLLDGTAGEKVLLTVDKGGKNGLVDVVIWPTSSLRSELYDDWVEQRRKLTNEYSNGRLGYLHIQGMNWTSFERFERELMAAGYGKEGIVIDVRYNGGGWTTDYLMAVLTVQQHAYTVPRGATESLENNLEFKETYPFGERLPLASWTKPSIAMCNENSYSNAEIFSHAYKTLDVGTLVGQPTFGAVISTGGWTLQDGSYVRMPFRAWYVKATEENMEHGPAVPDILVENPPAYKAKNIDPQLKRAVEELLGQL